MPAPTPGFAIRRNTSCLTSETDCGPTLAPFRGCCPSGLACPTQYNVACCPSGTNCTATLISAPQPRCANASWDLFDNGGFFCCEHGQSAYDRANSNVCAWPGAQLREGDRVLRVVREGQGDETVSSSAVGGVIHLSQLPSFGGVGYSHTEELWSTADESTLMPAAPTMTVAPGMRVSPGSEKKLPTGAIVGAVVGGCGAIIIVLSVFMAWYLLRWQRSRKEEKNPYLVSQRHEVDAADVKYRMDAQQVVHEVEGTAPGDLEAKELSGYQKPVKLPAEEVACSKKT